MDIDHATDQKRASADLEKRLKSFPCRSGWPTQEQVNIYWQENLIPFVESKSDSDCAFALGVVQGFLRLGQLELFRYIANGSVSSVCGPLFAPKLDAFIRMVNLRGSAVKSAAKLSGQERSWLERFVDGLNYFIDEMKELPSELRFLGVKPKKWNVVDTLAVARLAACDTNWATIQSFLKVNHLDDWWKVWKVYFESGKKSAATFNTSYGLDIDTAIANVSRTGSNSVVVSSKKTSTGAAMIASDPHLGVLLPNVWILLGYSCPSFHTIGYAFPGVPAISLGRNKHIAWGGTYMRGISSHVMKVDKKDITHHRKEKLKRRLWGSRILTFPETDKGTVFKTISKGKDKGKMYALDWAGRHPSNEFGAFWRLNKAKDWKGFCNSLEDYGVAGLNMTYADVQGNIGMALAIKQPLLRDSKELYNLTKSEGNEVVGFRSSKDLPKLFNPEEGFIASANNMPVHIDPQIAFVFGDNNRIDRLKELLTSRKEIDVDYLMQVQLDKYSPKAKKLSKDLIGVNQGLLELVDEKAVATINEWDGHYTKESEGALLFENFAWAAANEVFKAEIKSAQLRSRLLKSEDWMLYLHKKMSDLPQETLEVILVRAFRLGIRRSKPYGVWGKAHVLNLQSVLGMLPKLGGKFKYGEIPYGGASNTIMKARFIPSNHKKEVIFGAQARHISDMSHMDENYFSMLAGNDGCLESPYLLDQLDLFVEGRYVKLPLTLEVIKKSCKIMKVRPLEAKIAA